MKKLLLAIALVAGFSFSSFAAPAFSDFQVVSMEKQVGEFVEIEIADVPKAVTDAVAQKYEGATIKKAAFNKESKVYQITIETADKSEVVNMFTEAGEEVKEPVE